MSDTENIFTNTKISITHLQEIKEKGFFANRPFDLDSADSVLGITDKTEKKEEFWITLNFLRSLLDIHLEHKKEKNPFAPEMVMEGRRTMAIQDISKDQANILFKGLEDIESFYIKARVADILWETKLLDRDNIKAAEIAIQAYYDSLNYILEKHADFQYAFLYAGQQVQRLTTLILSIGKNGQKAWLYSKLLTYLNKKELLEKDDNRNLSYRVLESLLRLNISSENAQAVLTNINEKLLPIKNKMNSYSFRDLCSQAIIFAKIANNKEEETKFKISLAESFVEEANGRKESMVKSSFLKDAILAYVGIPNTTQRVEELKKQLSVIQKNIKNEMGIIKSGEIDITKPVLETQNNISGVSLEESIIRWLLLFNEFPSYTSLQKKAKQPASSSIADYVTNIGYDSEGKAIHVDGGQTEEDLINRRILRIFGMVSIPLCTNIIIVPAIKTIQKEHYITEEKIFEIIKGSNFIPPDHHKIFAKGFYYFMRFEMMSAVTLIVPQIESCLRHLIEPFESTSVIREDGVEFSKIDLEKLISSAKEHSVINETQEFYLKTILIHPLYQLRHNIAHGKVDNTVGDYAYCYTICMLIFRLVISHKIQEYIINNPSRNKLTLTNGKINRYVEIIDDFLKQNWVLFQENTQEITFTAALATMMCKVIPYYDIDIECTKNNPDELNIHPELVIHRRLDTENNLLVCIIAKTSNDSKLLQKNQEQLKKLTDRNGIFKYDIGCHLLINIGDKTVTSSWYENAKHTDTIQHQISKIK